MPQIPLNVPVGAEVSAPITTNTGTQVKSTNGVLAGVIVNTAGTSWTVTFYDGTSTSGTQLAVLAGDTAGPIVLPPIKFKTALFVETAGSSAGALQVAYF